jgi:DNA-binding NarL/FixJ family response regulator
MAARSSLHASRYISRLDLIIMDFRMPLADGIQAARKISASAPSISIVLYTLY